MQSTRILLLTIVLFLASCDTQQQEMALATDQQPAVHEEGLISDKAMVVSAHPLASEVGLDILRQGGNAYDAAIAVQFALAVVYPQAGNLGGGGFAVYRTATGEIGSLDFREKAPLAAHKDVYLREDGSVKEGQSLLGHLAVGVPGTVDGMFKLHEKMGSLPMEQLLDPAIRLAEDGFAATQAFASLLNKYQPDIQPLNPDAIHLYPNADHVWQLGDTLKQPDLAATLSRIRKEGRKGFYEGETAALIVAEMQENEGLITQEDLDKYESVWRKPVTGSYGKYRLISMPPPSSGGVALVQLMKSIEPYPIAEWGHNSAKTVHVMAELKRRVYADRATHLGDPDFYSVPVDTLLSKHYLRNRMVNIRPDKVTPSEEIKKGDVEVVESIETTHFSIVDQEGNAVSITTTLNGYFGSKVIVSNAGFFLNNEMDDFSIKPGTPNQFGLVGGEANAIAAEKRMLSSMTPTILEKDGKLFMVLGSPGGSTIITTVFQTILNVVEHNMNMQEAVNAPRFHHQWLPDRIMMEKTPLPQNTVQELVELGHEFEQRDGALGKVSAILVRWDGKLEGAADYTRSEDAAVRGM